ATAAHNPRSAIDMDLLRLRPHRRKRNEEQETCQAAKVLRKRRVARRMLSAMWKFLPCNFLLQGCVLSRMWALYCQESLREFRRWPTPFTARAGAVVGSTPTARRAGSDDARAAFAKNANVFNEIAQQKRAGR